MKVVTKVLGNLGHRRIVFLPGYGGSYNFTPGDPCATRGKKLSAHPVYDATNNRQGYVVLRYPSSIEDGGLWTLFHAYEAHTPIEAFDLAEAAYIPFGMNLIGAVKRIGKIWDYLEESQEQVITKQDAKDAGLCSWGVDMFWLNFSLPEKPTTTTLHNMMSVYPDAIGFPFLGHHLMMKERNGL